MKDMHLTLGDVLLGATEGKNFPVSAALPCKICQSDSEYFLSLDFAHHATRGPVRPYGVSVRHYRCKNCDHIFSNFCDDWSNEDFSKYIYNEFYANVDPEFSGARSRFFAESIDRNSDDKFRSASILDYGSGEGHLESSLREIGFKDVTSWDPFSGGDLPERKFDMIFAFEVLEHSPKPLDFIDDIIKYMSDDGVAYCSQEFIPEDIDNIRDRWWYFGPRNGHISFFSTRTVRELARKRDLNVKICDSGFFFWRKEMSPKVAAYVGAHNSADIEVELEGAPLIDDVAGWNELEEWEGGRFRWSAASRCPIGVFDIRRTKTTFSLRVLNSITENHLHGAKLWFNDDFVPLDYVDGRLVGTFVARARGKHFVWLETKPPVRPVDLGLSSDGRHLGVAIAAIDGRPDALMI
ncbi:class I SAM-dependent methyltransferase [uncultured Brevundimonas sp.]|uniref:class I SAM-dependent methyltransferase n=1 Tax=uncultured Brevundimonas sp. TaxID=213418 RepID=UPI00262E5AF1|nr:class I SAM-dependent methyltransferase [uncultured Brevundimonas sp.]